MMDRDMNSRHLTFRDMRLTRAMQDTRMRHATLEEYAHATGMSIQELLSFLKEHVESGDLAYETVGDQAFLLTRVPERSPRGLPPNLWEVLREMNDPEKAYTLWRLGRDLEQSGWQVNYHPPVIARKRPPLSLPLQEGEAPLILFPDPALLASPEGPLSRIEKERHPVCAVACHNKHVDRTVAAVRSWYLGQGERSRLSTLILEEPHYQPVRIDSGDGSHNPRSSSINAESRGSWSPPS